MAAPTLIDTDRLADEIAELTRIWVGIDPAGLDVLAGRALAGITLAELGWLLERALRWLLAHPDSSALQIARGIGHPDPRGLFRLLDNAAYDGRCQRWRPGPRAAWRWEIPQPERYEVELAT